MPECIVEREQRDSRVVFTLSGSFDGPSAWELAGRISAERAAELVIDFSRVGDFADHAVAVLSHAIPGR